MKSFTKDKNAPPAFYLSYVDGVLLKHVQWPECQARVQGRSGAKYKKAKSVDEARDILKGWGLDPKRFDDL
jgi:ribonuclease HI